MICASRMVRRTPHPPVVPGERSLGALVISESSGAVAADRDVHRLTRVTRRAGVALDGWGSQLPPRAQAEGTLRRLYETALVLFGNRGFHAVSVRDLTR